MQDTQSRIRCFVTYVEYGRCDAISLILVERCFLVFLHIRYKKKQWV